MRKVTAAIAGLDFMKRKILLCCVAVLLSGCAPRKSKYVNTIDPFTKNMARPIFSIPSADDAAFSTGYKAEVHRVAQGDPESIVVDVSFRWG